MLTNSYQLFDQGPISGPYVSSVFQTDSLSSWTLIVSLAGPVTGPTPTLTWAVQASPDGGTTWNQVGPNLTPMTPSLMHQATQYASDTAQGSIAAAGSLFRVIATPSAGSFWPTVYADITSQDQ